MSAPDTLWRDALYWSQQRATGRSLADLRREVRLLTPSGDARMTRRQCLYRARQAEAKIVNLAIRAERDATTRRLT